MFVDTSFFIISYFYRRSEAPSSELESAGQLFVKICKSQAVAVLSVAAFGYPTFTAEDDIKQYLCLVREILEDLPSFEYIHLPLLNHLPYGIRSYNPSKVGWLVG